MVVLTFLRWTVRKVLYVSHLSFPHGSPTVFLLQLNLFNTMMSLEQVYRDLGQMSIKKGENCVLVCDRGAMDVSACTRPTEYDVNALCPQTWIRRNGKDCCIPLGRRTLSCVTTAMTASSIW